MKSEEIKERPDIYRVVNISLLKRLVRRLHVDSCGEIDKNKIQLIAGEFTDLIYDMPRIPSLPAGENSSYHERPLPDWYPPHLTISQPVMELIMMVEKRRLLDGVVIDFGTKQEAWDQFRDYIVAMDAGIQLENKRMISQLVEAIEQRSKEKIKISGEDLVKVLDKAFHYDNNPNFEEKPICNPPEVKRTNHPPTADL